MEYYSQYGQDRFIDEYVFGQSTGGFFVDIGAHNGVSLSNTLAFEKFRGWDGICIEPMPERFAQLQANRKCRCVNGCIAPTSGIQRFTMVRGDADMLSGLSASFDEDHRQRIEAELRAKGGKQEVIDVQGYAFNELMEKSGVTRIDYCSIDTEGSEFEILQSMDFQRFGAVCYSIEENGHFMQMRRFLRPRGYRLVEKIGQDLVFVQEQKATSMPRVGFLKPGAFSVRVAQALARRLMRVISR
ncbi:MAG TPA: FkbM family methyltransferase [Tepidisphaeraceae bacterium]|nr:FkbM family methyltransferase [Tepidisphaeraceae bacterium]